MPDAAFWFVLAAAALLMLIALRTRVRRRDVGSMKRMLRRRLRHGADLPF